jgi:hypothetical protein
MELATTESFYDLSSTPLSSLHPVVMTPNNLLCFEEQKHLINKDWTD